MKTMYPFRMKHLFVLSFLLMNLLPSASITSYAAKASSPAPSLFYDDAELDAAKQDLMNMIYECMKVLDDSHQALSEKATSRQAPELYQQVDDIAEYLAYARNQLDQVTSMEGVQDLQAMLTDIRMRLADLRKMIEELEAAQTFTATTIEGVEMTFKVISEEDKTCQVGDGAGCSIHASTAGTVTIPASVNGYSVVKISYHAFLRCNSLNKVNLPNTIEYIDDYAFCECKNLKNIELPNSLVTLGNYSFDCCGIERIKIPASVRYICFAPFSSNASLSEIVVDENNPYYDSRNGCNAIIEKSKLQLIQGCNNTVIPEGIKSLGFASFCGMKGIKSMHIPEGITSIGEHTFYHCSALEEVTIPSTVQANGIGAVTFYDCTGLRTVRSFIKEPFALNMQYAGPFGRNGNGDVEYLTYSEATLYVPNSTKTLYEAAEGWNKFANIVEMEKGDDIIVFADANVKALCVENWDTNGDGELSYDEAAAVTTLGSVFYENKDITRFNELSYFTGLTEIGDNSFYDCRNLQEISFPASIIRIGEAAFFGDYALKNVILPEGLTRIEHAAFGICRSLTSLHIPKTVTYISNNGMAFRDCTGLTSITVDEQNQVYDSRNGCNAIIEKETLTLVNGCRTTVVPDGIAEIGMGAFYGQYGITTLELPASVKIIGNDAYDGCGFDALRIPNTVEAIHFAAFWNCHYLTAVILPENTPELGSELFLSNKLSSVYSYNRNPTAIKDDVFDVDWDGTMTTATLYVPAGTKSLYEATEGWKKFATIVEMDGTESFEPYTVLSDDNSLLTFYFDDQKDSRGGMTVTEKEWLEHKESITSVVFDESFAKCTILTSTAGWFFDCSKLKTIAGLTNLKTDNVTDMNRMFCRCSSLTSLDLSSLNTKNVKDMSLMFFGCYSLTDLNVSSFNTSSVTDMNYMFSNCSNLTNIDLSKFNTSKVTNMFGMFYNSTSLTNLDLSNFNTANVTNMGNMFDRCTSLSSIDLSNFNTENVTTMNWMFYRCENLTSLDLSSFNTANVQIMQLMFNGCSGLTTIYAGDEWSTEKVTDGLYMFGGCTNIVGGNGTKYDASHIDYTYAHIDGGTSNPGYFTDVNSLVDIEPLEDGDVIDFGDFVDESGVEVLPALDGNVVGNLYFNILNDNGGYDAEEGCIVITESTADETIEWIADKDFYDKELRETFTGIIFKVPAGSGNIKITAEALGSMLLKVRIGDDEPQSFELDGRQKVKISYTVSEETLVYIYAGEDAAVKGVHPVTASSGMLRIFGIESESIPTTIAEVEMSVTPVAIYSVSGQRLAKPQKGINIIGGKKVVVK